MYKILRTLSVSTASGGVSVQKVAQMAIKGEARGAASDVSDAGSSAGRGAGGTATGKSTLARYEKASMQIARLLVKLGYLLILPSGHL